MPFVKLDCGLLDSSLWIDRNLRDVFITALLMAEPKEFSEPQRQIEVDTLNFTDFVAPPEWYGFCPAAGSGIVRRALVEPTAGMEALKQLGSADPESRNKKFDGRRMIRVNGGFLILNYMDFRDHDYTAADRMRRLRARQRSSVTRNVNDVTPNKRNDVTKNEIVHPNVTQAESRVQRAEAEGERPPTPQKTKTATEPQRKPPQPADLKLGPVMPSVLPEPFLLGKESRPEPFYDADDDPEENIPDGMPILQYAGFVLERARVPAGYMLKVHAGDALGMLAKEEACSLALATKRMLDRMRAAEKQGPVKWNFWLQDGGWKQRVEAGISTEGWERETD